jgi:hypothetical protein
VTCAVYVVVWANPSSKAIRGGAYGWTNSVAHVSGSGHGACLQTLLGRSVFSRRGHVRGASGHAPPTKVGVVVPGRSLAISDLLCLVVCEYVSVCACLCVCVCAFLLCVFVCVGARVCASTSSHVQVRVFVCACVDRGVPPYVDVSVSMSGDCAQCYTIRATHAPPTLMILVFQKLLTAVASTLLVICFSQKRPT